MPKLCAAILATSALLLPLPALADEACVAVRPTDQDEGERKYEIWLERGPQVDFSYAWSCVVKTQSSTSEASNSSFAFRKPDQDDKLGACSAFIEQGTQARITVDLWLSPTPAPNEQRKKVGTMVFELDATAAPAAERQCRPL